MNSEGIKITGKGTVEEDTPEKKEEKLLRLIPLPDQAIEYGATPKNPLEDIVNESESKVVIEDSGKELKEAVINEQEQITNLNLTENINKTEFVPKEQNALIDTEEEGGAARVVVAGPIPIKEQNEPQYIKSAEAMVNLGSKKSNFDPGSVQSALTDQPVEGGVISAKSTGPMPSDGDAAKEGFQMQGLKEEDLKNKFRVYGFTIQFKKEDGTTGTKNVSDYFDDLDTAFISVNATKYLMPLPNNDGYKIVSIVSGIPEISFQDTRVYKYDKGMWKKM